MHSQSINHTVKWISLQLIGELSCSAAIVIDQIPNDRNNSSLERVKTFEQKYYKGLGFTSGTLTILNENNTLLYPV